MLVNRGYAEGDIVTFKLVNGDEIVAKIVNKSVEGDFIVNRPCIAIPTQDRGLGLMQAMFSGDINTNVTLKGQHIMMHSPTVDAIQSHYIKTTTGIETIPKGKILT